MSKGEVQHHVTALCGVSLRFHIVDCADCCALLNTSRPDTLTPGQLLRMARFLSTAISSNMAMPKHIADRARLLALDLAELKRRRSTR